jgi:hypothetical protein
MTAIVYPAGLPRMQLWPAVSRERRAVSGGEGIKAAPRARSRDRIADIDAQWFYKPVHMAAWSAWYEDVLLNGTRWFAINAPGPGGWMQRVCRYRTATVRREALPGGHWRVTAQLEQRGRSALPQVPYEIDLHCEDNAGLTSAVGIAFNGLNPAFAYRVEVVSRVYTTWSRWASDGVADGGLPWECSFAVTTGAGTTDYLTARYATAAAAFAAATPITITGHTTYTFWLYDNILGDNRGGLSLAIYQS